MVIAIAMSVLGLVGVTTSLSDLVPAPPPPMSTDPSVSIDVQNAARALMEALDGSSIHHALSVANLLVSALLLLASFALTGRTRNAIWWATQALTANALYTLAAGAGNAYLFHAKGELLLALFRAVAVAQSSPLDGIEIVLPFTIACTLVFGTLGAAIYLVLLRFARQKDVRRFVAREV